MPTTILSGITQASDSITMKINDQASHSIPLQSATSQLNNHQTKIEHNDADQTTSGVNEPNTVEISSIGSLYQSIDKLTEQLDDIYLSHMTTEERQQVESAYKQLDEIFGQTEPSEQKLKGADKILDKIDQIFARAEQSFSKDDWQTLSNTESAIDDAFDQLKQQEEAIFTQIDTLDKEQMQIISSQLSSHQQQSLSTLNEQLNRLFDNATLTETQEEQVEKLFGQIDKLTNMGFERLSREQQEKVNGLEQKISGLYDAVEAE